MSRRLQNPRLPLLILFATLNTLHNVLYETQNATGPAGSGGVFIAEQFGDTRTFNPGVGESPAKDISAEHKARYPTLGRRFHLLFSHRLTQTSTVKPHLDPVSAFGPF